MNVKLAFQKTDAWYAVSALFLIVIAVISLLNMLFYPTFDLIIDTSDPMFIFFWVTLSFVLVTWYVGFNIEEIQKKYI